MSEGVPLVLLFGIIVIATVYIRQACLQLQVQPLVGFVLVGLAVGLVGQASGLLTNELRERLDVLGQFGVVILLFKVGLNSDITGLLKQLRRAIAIWFSNVAVAGLAGFLAANALLDYALLPSLFVAVAMSATSIGVSAATWEAAGRLNTDEGELVLDVAELDDITAVLFMVMLFTAAPFLANGDLDQLWLVVAEQFAWMAAKLCLFTVGVYLFARFAEQRFTRAARNRGGQIVAITGMACLVAGLAAWIGFSAAIGALFAGLAFSRDPQEFSIDTQLEPIYRLLSPFFFVVIGMSFELASALTALVAAAVLFVAAVASKILGAGLPAMMVLGAPRGWLIGVSMVPRAEIAMVIMLQGSRMGAEYVPAELLGAMSLVVVATVLLVPFWLNHLLPSVDKGKRTRSRTANIEP
jgi:Kef-type K+ transport system membrane component KefB